MVIASIESQGKFIQETMKNYLALLEVVDKLREKEESKVEVRGGGGMSSKAETLVKSKEMELLKIDSKDWLINQKRVPLVDSVEYGALL